MRTLILGAGGIGGYFGARIAAAGGDVTFLVRPARARLLAENGLVVRSPTGDLTLAAKTATDGAAAAAEGAFDLIMLACKAYDLDSAMDAIAPAVGPDTLILPLLNGLRHLDSLDARFGRDRVLGGLAHIGVTLTEAGEILHLNSLQRLTLGARTPGQAARAEAIHAAFAGGGFKLLLSGEIEQEMWEKFVFICSYAGITCLMRADIGAIAATNDGSHIALELLAECVATATAHGYAPRGNFSRDSGATLTDKTSQGTASMLRDMERSAATEHEPLLGDMLRRARLAGIATPVLRVANAHMQAYEQMRQKPR